MSDLSKPYAWKLYEFDNAFWTEARPYGFVDVLQVGEVSCDRAHVMDEHINICHEITYIISGIGKITTDGMDVDVSAGDVLLTRKGQQHIISSSYEEQLRFYYLGFNFNKQELSDSVMELERWYASNRDIIFHDIFNIKYPLSQIMSEFYHASVFSNELINTYIKQVLFLVYRLFTCQKIGNYLLQNSANPKNDAVYTVIRYIDENLFNIRTIGDVASKLGFNSCYLSRIFKEKTGITLQTFITDRKIEKAKEMIATGYMNVTQIAKCLNYKTVQSFCKVFKKNTGCTPMEYRSQSYNNQSGK